MFPEWMKDECCCTWVRQCLLFELGWTSKHMVHTLNKTRDIFSSAVFIMWKTAHIALERPSLTSNDTEISTWTTPVSSLPCYQSCNQIWNLKLSSECPSGDTVIQDGAVNPGVPPCWSGSSQAHLSGPPRRPKEMCHLAVYSKRGSPQNGRSPTFLQNHRQCQGHQTGSSFPKSLKSWLISIKEIRRENLFSVHTSPLSIRL